MKREVWESLGAETPPAGFADRVVAAALRERRERFGRGPRAHSRGHQAVFVAIAATLLLSGAAWGFSRWARPVAPATVGAPVTTASAPLLEERPVRASPMADTDGGTERDAAVRMPAQPVLHRLKSVKVDAKSDAGAKVIVPPCECVRDQVICTCF